MMDDFDYNFHMRISIVPTLPWLQVILNGSEIFVNGVLGSLLKTLASKYNFTYNLIPPPDREWGVLRNGSWTGMVGMIIRNESDIIVSPFAQTEERFNVVRLSESYRTTTVVIMAGGIPFEEQNVFSFFKSFNREVWFMLFLSLPLVVWSLSALECCVPNRQNSLSNWIQEFRTKSIRNLWVILGSLFNESTWVIHERVPPQFVMGVWWLAIVVLMNSFTGQMKASMTFEAEKDIIDDLQELAQKTTLPAFMALGTAYADLFKTGETYDYQEVWRRTSLVKGVIPMSQVLSESSFRKVQKGEFVVIQEESTVLFASARHCRKLWDQPGSTYMVKERLFPHQLSVAFRMDIPEKWAHIWNFGILRLRESGIILKWEDETTGPWMCGGTGGDGEKNITITEFTSVMALWAITILISCLVFLWELIVHRWTMGRKKHRSLV